ncbi:unnamed protein product, partial [Closterium sp. Yama58-4]
MASPAKPSWKRRWAAEAHLRGHRAEVTALCHHAASDFLLSGDMEGEVRAWSLATHRPVARHRLHGSHAGIIAMDAVPPATVAPSLAHSLLTQGRDGVVRCWAVESVTSASSGSAAPPSPLFTVHTGAFTLCRMALPSLASPAPCHPPPPPPCDGALVSAPCSGASEPRAAHARAAGAQQAGEGDGRGGEGRGRGEPRRGLLSGALGAVEGGRCEGGRAEGEALEGGSTGEDGRGREEVGAAASGVLPAVLATPCDDNCTVALWDLRHPTRRSLSIGSPQGFPHAAPHPHSAASAGLPMALHLMLSPSVSPALFLLAGYEDGRMALWDVRRPDRPLTAVRLHSHPVQSVAVWSSGEHGVSGGADTDTVFFRLSLSQGSMEVVKRVRAQQPGTAAIALHPAGGVAATGGWDGSVRLYDCAHHHSPRPAAHLTHHSAA